jgi:hypothetical protein
MLEKPAPHVERVWDTNNVWLVFLFLCLGWVSIMILIIHRDVLNRQHVADLIEQKTQVELQMIPLQEAEQQSQEYQNLRLARDRLETRIVTAQLPPTSLFIFFSVFEVLFIIAYYLLLWRLRPEIPSLTLFLYLLSLPLGFVYFFLLITIGRYHSWSQLFGDFLTPALALYFALGLIVVSVHALLWGERRRSPERPSAGS